MLTALRAAGAIVAVWLVGSALLRGRLPAGLRAVEAHAARLVTGLGALSLAAVALADLGLHAPWSIAAVTAALIAAGFACNPPDSAEAPRITRTDLALVAALLATTALALPGFEWSLGGRDAGTYVNEVVQIQERGSVEVSEPSLDTVPAGVRRALPLGGRYPGEYFGDQPGEIIRLGFHTWPALRAAAGYATGDEGRLVAGRDRRAGAADDRARGTPAGARAADRAREAEQPGAGRAGQPLPTRTTRRAAAWLEHYNRHRPHGSLNRQSPLKRLQLLRNNGPGPYT